jgi:hypothetical protein
VTCASENRCRADRAAGISKFTRFDDSLRKHALTTDTQNAGDDEAEHPIHRDKEKTGEQDHEKNKPRRDQGLAARRPRNLGAFRADLLKEFQRVSHFYVCSPTKVAPIRGGALSTSAHDHDKPAKGIAKKSGRGTRRQRAALFPYNPSRVERKFNFLAGRNATPARPQNLAVRTWAGGKNLET